jgi:hypothetical protein
MQFFLAAIYFLSIFSLNSQHYTYKTKTEDLVQETSWVFTTTKDLLNVEGTNADEKIFLEYAENHVLAKYRYENEKQKTNFTITRKNQELIAEGSVKGKKLFERHEIKNDRWMQQLGFDLEPFVKSSEKTCYFFTVNPNDFSLQKLMATKQEIEKISIEGKSYEAQKILLNVAGWKKMFWQAEIWFDKESHLFLSYKGNEGPNTPTSTTSLMP